MLTVLRTAAAPTSASSSHLGHVEHNDQVSGRTRSGKGWWHGAVPTHERSCVPPAREGAQRPRTRVRSVGAHLDALHEDETFDPRDDRRLHDECVLVVVIAVIISIVVVLRLCLSVPVGTTPPSSHPSLLPLRSLVRYLSRLGPRSDRKRRCCGVCILVSRASYRLPARSAAMSSAVRFSITPKPHHNYIQLHQPSYHNYITTTSQLHHNYITTTSQLHHNYITTPSQLHHNSITTPSQLHQPSQRSSTQNYISHLHQGTTPL